VKTRPCSAGFSRAEAKQHISHAASHSVQSLPPPCRHTHEEEMLTHATAVASRAPIPEWEVIYFKKWQRHLPLPAVRRKGKNLPLVLTSASGLACPHSRSHVSASSDSEALGFLCTLHSGNSLFSPWQIFLFV